MAKSGNQKGKLLYLAEIFHRETDEAHGLTLAELTERLAAYGVQAERKTLYADMEELRRCGLDIDSWKEGREYRYRLASREFELPELKLLVDVVQSSRFITRKKSDALIRKLEGLASSHQARQLQRQVYVSGRVKAMNESIYYNVDKLHTALSARKSITFRYFDYDMHRNKVFRREGRRYAVSPYGLIWNSENYYLVAYDISNQEMRHYRVDKMAEIVVTGLPREGEDRYPDFDVAAYGQKHFGMYSGEEASVTLRCRSHMAGVVWDRFGQDVILVPEDEDHFTVTLPLVLSPQFFGWLFGLEDNVELIAPQKAAEEYRRKLKAVLEQYG